MILGDFLKNLAAKIGQQDNAELATLITSLGKTDIPDSIATALDTGLMSFEGAKANTALQAHFKPTFLNAVDDQFRILAEKYGISDAMLAEKNTYKKANLLEAELAKRLAAAEAKSGDAQSKAEIDKLNKTITDLQGQLRTISEAKDNEIKTLNDKFTAQQTDMLINFELGNKNYANKELDKRVSVITASTLLKQALAQSKAIVVNENGSLKLKQAENPAMAYVDSGFREVSFKDYTDKLLADNHLLEVSGGGSKTTIPTVTTPAAGQPTVSSAFAAAIDAAKLQ